MVPEKGRGRGSELKVAYTNIDGIISTALELKDFLRKEQPDIMGIVETKITGGIDALKASVRFGDRKKYEKYDFLRKKYIW